MKTRNRYLYAVTATNLGLELVGVPGCSSSQWNHAGEPIESAHADGGIDAEDAITAADPSDPARCRSCSSHEQCADKLMNPYG